MLKKTSPDSRETTGERSHNKNKQVPLTAEFGKLLTKSSPGFGALSQHSFFSRHNPHPHRVRHIQGLNGRPICTVRDDWFVTSSLFPHPLLKSHIIRKAPEPAFASPFSQNLACGIKNKSALFSEAWRDELKELATKVSLSSQTQKNRTESQPKEELICRKTQYSAVTGRIIPSSTMSYQRKSQHQRANYPQPFHDQELTVLELLCEILQTDSLSAVQQWLLLAGEREKDLVMGMIREALDGLDLSRHDRQSFQQPNFGASGHTPSYNQPWRKVWRMSSYQPSLRNEKPEMIGEAEVLQVHTGP